MSVTLDSAMWYELHATDARAQEQRPLYGDRTDSDLVARAKTGDSYAFEELVRRYRNDVFAVAYHFVRNREEAWDLSQEVFIKVHRALRRFRGEASLKTWVLRITANQCKDHLKKRRLETVPYNDALAAGDQAQRVAGPSDALEAQELGQAIRRAVDSLPHKHKTAIVLREFEGLSYQEMAEAMGCSIGTVMSRLHHARKKIQNRLVEMRVVEEEGYG